MGQIFCAAVADQIHFKCTRLLLSGADHIIVSFQTLLERHYYNQIH